MNITQFLSKLLVVSNVEIVIPLLPEMLRAADQAPRYSLLQRPQRICQRSLFDPTCGPTQAKGWLEWATRPMFTDRALIKFPLVAPANANYGLDRWVQLLGSSQIINSGYRNPVQNKAAKGVPYSRHMFGDAVDLQNQLCPSSNNPCSQAGIDQYNFMVTQAGNIEKSSGAQADYVETPNLPCGYNCVHADWRYHDYGLYVH
jgi:hypothetical protein